MITNVPSTEDLDKAALRSYFAAWTALVDMATDFDNYFYGDGVDWSKEKAEYIEGCQSDLQSCRTLMQQSNELALKARIAKVSPFLLLFRNDRKLSLVQEDIDFADLRTLDAYDLSRAVNSFCPSPLSNKFIADYELVRGLRNKIIHLGSVDRHFEPDDLLKLMTRQFIELWPDRRWLVERYNYAKRSRFAFFHDGKHSSAEGEVLAELDDTLARFTKSEFKKLIGFDKSAPRYLCPECIYSSEVRRAEIDLTECGTAFLLPGESAVQCAMCEGSYRVRREKCGIEDCLGNVISDTKDSFEGMCLTCGEY